MKNDFRFPLPIQIMAPNSKIYVAYWGETDDEHHLNEIHVLAIMEESDGLRYVTPLEGGSEGLFEMPSDVSNFVAYYYGEVPGDWKTEASAAREKYKARKTT